VQDIAQRATGRQEADQRPSVLPRRAALATMALGLPWLGGCSVGAALSAMTAKGQGRLLADQSYGPDPRQSADLFLPGRIETGTPAILFFYGGSWNRGDRETYRFVGHALAARGCLVAVADYRLYPQVRYPAFLDDGALALRWFRAQLPRLGAAAAPVYLMGHSAGAYNAAMLALDGRWLAAVGERPQALAGWIGLAGPYDFLPIANPDVRPVFGHPNVAPDSQVFAHVRAGAPAAFLGAATQDDLVDPQRNTAGLARRLREVGVPVVERFYDQANHMTLIGAFAGPLRWVGPVLADVADFVGARVPA